MLLSSTLSNFNTGLVGPNNLSPEDKNGLDNVLNQIQSLYLNPTSTEKIEIIVQGGESRVTNADPFTQQGSLAKARATTIFDYIRINYPSIWNNPLLGDTGGVYQSISPPGTPTSPENISCRKNFKILSSIIGKTTWINNTDGTLPALNSSARGTINPPQAAWGNAGHPVYTAEQFVKIIVEYENRQNITDPCSISNAINFEKKATTIPETGLIYSYPFSLNNSLRPPGTSPTERVTGIIKLYFDTLSFPDYIQILFLDNQGNINKKGIIPLTMTMDTSNNSTYVNNLNDLFKFYLDPSKSKNPIFNYLPIYTWTLDQGDNKRSAMYKYLYVSLSYCLPSWEDTYIGTDGRQYNNVLTNGSNPFLSGVSSVPMFYTPTQTPTLIPSIEKINPIADPNTRISQVYINPSTAPPNALTVPIISCSIVNSTINPSKTNERANPIFSGNPSDPTYIVVGSVPFISGSERLLEFNFDSDLDKHMLIQVFGFRNDTNFKLRAECIPN